MEFDSISQLYQIAPKPYMITMGQTTLIILCAESISMKAVRTGNKYHFVCTHNVYSFDEVLTSVLLAPATGEVDL